MRKPAPCKNCKFTYLLTTDGLCVNCSARGEVKASRVHALRILGGCCRCCGEADYRFLEIDHVYDDGKAHRRQLRENHTGLFRWIKTNQVKANEELQVLCANCHAAKTRYGYCPHLKMRDYSRIHQQLAEIENEVYASHSRFERVSEDLSPVSEGVCGDLDQDLQELR